MVVIRRKKDSAEKTKAEFKEGQKVTLVIFSQTTMGFVGVINGTHKGVLYKNEVFQPLKIGQKISGYIKKVRDDKKIDLCLHKSGYKAIDPQLRKIMDELHRQGGFIKVTDKSSPKEIADLFGISKKTFKKTIGNLYKKRLIVLKEKGIQLAEKKELTPHKPGARRRKFTAKARRV